MIATYIRRRDVMTAMRASIELMAGTPSLRIGQHGRIQRIYLGAGV
jgi:hypothetical protein